ncbi:glycerophosphodiester phosphodiesterase family protein [Micrococcus cohnii]|uniref:Glycerophosphoryl diester phosphodiesterase n=1 Tax=Micrococcus cohnii TaxID=993416 RepID=A0A7W7GQD6_9MICC|nr:glycerophosphodiester phosphodiesterase family protein [Micrococcus cohnii]MBB4736374.1 glycerophosphoryl diester phosphodiesterase [Micrococcus cohnii]
MTPLVIAHRGASADHAEHTRAAYLRALDDGADGLECDVQLTRDKQVVCWHDPTVDRTSDGSGAVSDHTLAQLRRLNVHGWHPGGVPTEYGAPREQMLTLAELLRIALDAGRPLRLAVELKHPSPFGHELEEKTMRELAFAGWDPETGLMGQVQVSLMSFHAEALRYLAPLTGPDPLCPLIDLMPTGTDSRLARGPVSRAAVRAAMRMSLAESERLVWTGQAQLAGPSVAYMRAHLADAKAWLAAGRRLRVWTADQERDVAFLAAHGVQEITTNRPAAVRRALEAGQQGAHGVVSRVTL